MSSRKDRFVDTNFDSFNRPHHQPNPCATKQPPDDFSQVKNLLQQELATNTLYSQIWTKATRILAQKKQYLSSSHFQKSTPSECYIAIVAYSLDDEVWVNGRPRQLYRDFNDKFRALNGEESWKRFPYKSFYYLLVLAYPGIKHNPNPNQTLYRGIEGFYFAAPKPGDEFYFDHFASSSSDRHVAERFLGDNGTMVVVKGGAEAAMGITNYAQFDEKEVLIMPCNKFKVVKYTRVGPIDELVIEAEGGWSFGTIFGGIALGVLAVVGMALSKD